MYLYSTISVERLLAFQVTYPYIFNPKTHTNTIIHYTPIQFYSPTRNLILGDKSEVDHIDLAFVVVVSSRWNLPSHRLCCHQPARGAGPRSTRPPPLTVADVEPLPSCVSLFSTPSVRGRTPSPTYIWLCSLSPLALFGARLFDSAQPRPGPLTYGPG